MNYVKITNRQISTLKSLPSNLNDSVHNQNISGILFIDKLGQFKQIIFDFQTSNLEEFYTDKDKSKIQLYKHIKNECPRKYKSLTFDIINKLNSDTKNDFGLHLDSTNLPSIEQWLKCTIHAIMRKIYNHLVICPSDNVYTISIKKTYYYQILNMKFENNWKIKELLHYLIKSYTDIYHEYTGSKLQIPPKFNEYFSIIKSKNTDIIFMYKSFNEIITTSK